jgi:glycosyltransferase involved in cell wall biosynthesis
MSPVNDGERSLRVGLLGMEWSRTGGLGRYLSDLHRTLNAQRIDAVAVAAGRVLDGERKVFASGGPLDGSFLIRAARYWLRTQALSVDVLDAHFAPYALGPIYFGRLRKLPLVVHFHGSWTQESVVEGCSSRIALLAKHYVERAVYRRASELITLSGAYRRLLVETYGVSPWRVHVLAPGVDLDHFSPGSPLDARLTLGIAAEIPVAVTVRRLVARTGVDVLLDAWPTVVGDHPEALLLVVGKGPMRAQLEGRVVHNGIGASVRFLGKLDEGALATCYRAADLSVVPSVALEGFGLIVLESLACGTPVVATDTGGLPETLAGLAHSSPVPARDPVALGSRLCDALDPRGDALPSPTACRSHAEQFSWEAVAAANVEVYRRAIHPPKRRSLRVVYLDHCARLSGAEIALARLLPSMHDVESHVILAENGPLVHRLIQAGVSVEVLSMPEGGRGLGRDQVVPGVAAVSAGTIATAYAARLARRLRKLEPDLVHANGLKAALYGGVAGRTTGIPVVWHIHDRIAGDYMPGTAVALVRTLARVLPSALIANSATTLKTLGRHRGPHVVIPSPVTILPERRSATNSRPLTVGMLGRLAPWKGQDIFVRAFARTFPEGSEQAVIVGSALFGEEAFEDRLRRLIGELGFADRVALVGFREDVAAELASIDVLVHASVIPEPLGQVVMEGMAAGLPVVAANAGGPAEVIVDGTDGLLYPPGDVEALSAVLARLAADPDLRQRLGRAAQLRAPAWLPERIAALMTAFYHQVLGASAPTRAQ